MTNEQRRRAPGAANAANRQGSGAANAAERRAGGAAMIERRTGKSQVDEINSVVVQPKARKTLRTISPRGPLPAQTSPGTDTPNPKPTGGGGGIASPLTEPDATQRTYYDPVLLPTTDGLAWVSWRSVRRIEMVDAGNAEVVLEFANGLS
ncbi:hypothetical protein [Pseudomonas sp. GWSMS-1]|uniref:hypothetical protein n=1 Tax=Pseudomonas sp. GWSMS-1 TaxID=3308997 RepID=UPI003CE6704E